LIGYKKGIFSNNMDGKFKLIIGKAFDESGVTTESKVLSAVESCGEILP